MTCPNCRCPACKAAAVNAVLETYAVPRETENPDAHNAAILRDNREREQWRDTFVDPDAEQLAADVVLEHARAG